MFDERDLRHCFGLFSTGVMVAATNHQEKIYGLTINSFSSVSLNPALLLFSIGNDSSNLEIFKNSASYSLNILAKSQASTAISFASSKREKIENFSLTPNKNPVFEKSVGFFECVHHKIVQAGDHHIFIGEIIDFAVLSDEEGLFYYKGKFC